MPRPAPQRRMAYTTTHLLNDSIDEGIRRVVSACSVGLQADVRLKRYRRPARAGRYSGRDSERQALEKLGWWRARRGARIEKATRKDEVRNGNGSGLRAIDSRRPHGHETVAQRTKRVAGETVIGIGGARHRAAVEAVGVVIVVNGNGIARRVVPSGVTQTAGADADDGRDEQRNRASTSAT